SKYGCSGCHDIPGYEDVKPIGTGLADWGRKSADKLAFEQITQYILHGHGAPPQEGRVNGHDEAYQGPHGEPAAASDAELAHAEGAHELNFEDMDPGTGFFMQKFLGHERGGL